MRCDANRIRRVAGFVLGWVENSKSCIVACDERGISEFQPTLILSIAYCLYVHAPHKTMHNLA